MRYQALLLLIVVSMPAAMADVAGLVSKPSPHSVAETLDRLEAALDANDIQVALRWDHAEKAEQADFELRDTELLLFGNPALGSQLFTSAQSSGIDLPMKALAWEDESGQVWLAYNDPAYLAERHGIDDRDEVIATMTNALDNLTDAAVSEN